MNKKGVIDIVCARTDISYKTVNYIINTFLDVVSEELIKGKRIILNGFGAFRLRNKRAYLGANPYSGERIMIPAKRLPFFDACAQLKARINDRWTTPLEHDPMVQSKDERS